MCSHASMIAGSGQRVKPFLPTWENSERENAPEFEVLRGVVRDAFSFSSVVELTDRAAWSCSCCAKADPAGGWFLAACGLHVSQSDPVSQS